MDVMTYAFASVFIIMLWHFAFNTHQKYFGMFQIIGVFVIGGMMGYFMNSMESGILISLVLSLIFI